MVLNFHLFKNNHVIEFGFMGHMLIKTFKSPPQIIPGKIKSSGQAILTKWLFRIAALGFPDQGGGREFIFKLEVYPNCNKKIGKKLKSSQTVEIMLGFFSCHFFLIKERDTQKSC